MHAFVLHQILHIRHRNFNPYVPFLCLLNLPLKKAIIFCHSSLHKAIDPSKWQNNEEMIQCLTLTRKYLERNSPTCTFGIWCNQLISTNSFKKFYLISVVVWSWPTTSNVRHFMLLNVLRAAATIQKLIQKFLV